VYVLMRWTILAPAVSLAAVLAAPASAALSDFRLPGQTTQQQPPPDRQGPVAPDVPESQRPLPTPTPTATRAPTPTPTPPILLPDLSEPDSETPTARTPPRPAATRLPAPTDTAAPTAGAAASEAATADGFGLPSTATTPSPLPASAPASASASDHEGGSIWPWVLGALAALGGLAFGTWAWQRRRSLVGPSTVPEIQRPRLAPAPAAAALPPQPAPPAAADVSRTEPLQVTLDPLRLSLTLMNATLAYRLEITNRSTAPIVSLGIGADMIAAHASMSREQQLSGPGADARTVQRIERLEPGESRLVAGEFRVPFTQIVPIRQGNAALLLPLARFRLTAEGAAPVVRTFAVGQPGANRGLQPFRLDLGPRVYPQLAQRAFA
jgi:hypothetical protein